MEKIMEKHEIINITVVKNTGGHTEVDDVKKFYIFKFYKLGRTIICKVYDDYDNCYAKGIAQCHIDDEFVLDIGIKLSEIRAKSNAYKYLEEQLINNYL